jgi:ABC-type transport system involved in multi-copper enzyme maturation permease subunit
MTRTLHSEWTKLRTQRGTLVALLATGVLMAGFSAFFASEQHTETRFPGDDDVIQMSLMGVAFAELAVVVVGASLITSEFATGMMRTTLTATQGRARVLAAKAIVLCIAVFPVALVAAAVGFVPAQSLLRANGYAPPAYAEVSLTDPTAIRAVVGTALLLTAYAVIALGLGTILRHSGATIAAGVGVLFLPLLFLGTFPATFARRMEQLTPLAGMAIQSRGDRMLSAFDGRAGMPIQPWQGLAVAFAWALGLLVLGGLALRYRDV